MLRGDLLRELLVRGEWDELIALCWKRYPQIKPDQAVNRYLAEAETTILEIEAFRSER